MCFKSLKTDSLLQKLGNDKFIAASKYEGIKYVSIREWNTTNEKRWWPTKNGLFYFIRIYKFEYFFNSLKRGKTGKEGPKNIFPFTLVLIPIFSYHLPNIPLREL